MRSIASQGRIVPLLFIATISFVFGCANEPTASATPSPARAARSTSEPFYVPGAGVTLVAGDNMDRYTDAVSMGAYPYQYTGPQFSPNPAPSQTSTPVDTAYVSVIAPGRGDIGQALRMTFDGAYQEGHALATVNVPTQPDNETVYIQYYARVTPGSDWPLSQPVAVKWLQAFHNHSLTRLEFATRYPSSTDINQTAPTVWQVIDQAESPGNGDQPLGPYFHQLADGQWHRYTYALKSHTSTRVKDGFAQMWVDGTLIIDIEQATVGVVPPGGLRAWCTQDDVNHIIVADGVGRVTWGGTQTTVTGSWTYDVDDVLWWRKQ
jgi:hypothetical protein